MDVPTKVKVGAHTYTVVLVDSSELDIGLRGECDSNEFVIRLSKELPLETIATTLFHELLHALWDSRSMPKRIDEERAVLNFEEGILQLLRDNPKLFPWLRKSVK